jgi:hypothetical protein
VGFPTLLTAPDALAPEARAALSLARRASRSWCRRRAVVSPAVVRRSRRWASASCGWPAPTAARRPRWWQAFAVERLGFERATVTLARGDAFADALAGAAFAGDAAVPLLLTAGPTTLGPATRSYLQARVGVTTGGDRVRRRRRISAATLAERSAHWRPDPPVRWPGR